MLHSFAIMPLSVIDDLSEILVPIGICVVLPVMVVWLWTRIKTHEANSRTKIILAALEKGKDADLEPIIMQLAPEKKGNSVKWRIVRDLRIGSILLALGLAMLVVSGMNMACSNLGFQSDSVQIPGLFGLILTFIGAAFLVVYFTSRRFMDKEIAHEESHMEVEKNKTND